MIVDTAYSPTISLVTVCRNSSDTIAKTIESVLVQKDANVEYLIIDGASIDGTQDIVRSYPGIDYFVSEPDQGIADAFNKGVCLATGEIIGLINSDDMLHPGTIEKVRQFFVDCPDTEVLHGDLLLYDRDKAIKRLKPSGRWWYPWRLVLFNHPATFVRREVYQRYGLFDTNYRIAMDVEIFIRWLTKRVRISYLPEILASMQAGGVSGQHAVRGYREVLRAALQHGLSPLLAYFQFISKVSLWYMLEAASRSGRKHHDKKSTRATL